MSDTDERNPLLIDKVLSSVFSFAKYDSLKNCRLVNQKWMDVCDPIFREASIINTTNEMSASNNLQSYLEYTELFDTLFYDGCYFSFIYGENLLTRPVKELCFDQHRNSIVELVIKADSKMWADVDYSIDYLIGPKLKKLAITGVNDFCDMKNPPKRCRLSLDKLSSIIKLSLESCIIVANSDEIKIEPEQLTLVDVLIMKNGEIDKEKPNINDIVNFDSLEKLNLNMGYDYQKEYYCNMSVNFSDCVNIKDLSLTSVHINLDGIISPKMLELGENVYNINGILSAVVPLNCFLSSSHLNLVKLCDYQLHFDFGTLISIEELRIIEGNAHNSQVYYGLDESVGTIKKLAICCPPVGHLCLRNLPRSVENLHISGSQLQFNPGESASFPNLRQLTVSNVKHLEPFMDCESLEELSLAGDSDYSSSTNPVSNSIARLPPNIKRLALQDIYDIEVLDGKVYKLDAPFLTAYRYSWKYGNWTKFKPDLVVFSTFHEGNKTQMNESTVSQLMDIQKERKINVAFGPVKWSSPGMFEVSPLRNVVTEEAEYYFLEGETGKSMSKEDFYQLMPFPLDDKNDYVCGIIQPDPLISSHRRSLLNLTSANSRRTPSKTTKLRLFILCFGMVISWYAALVFRGDPDDLILPMCKVK